MNMTPACPMWWFIAACKRSIPISPFVTLSGARSIMKAEQLHINNVSINTPKAWINPCLTGWATSAAAAAHGADPEPASLENNPLFTPCINIAPNPPATACLNPKACTNIFSNIWGKSPIFFIIINNVTEKYSIAIAGTTLLSTSTIPAFLNNTIPDITTKAIVVYNGGKLKAFANDWLTELAITWLIPAQQSNPESANNTPKSLNLVPLV